MTPQFHFRYYHGESTCPYISRNERLFWMVENRCANGGGSDEYDGWTEYYRIKGYKLYDDVPSQILMTLFLQWLGDDEEKDMAGFYGLVEEYRNP